MGRSGGGSGRSGGGSANSWESCPIDPPPGPQGHRTISTCPRKERCAIAAAAAGACRLGRLDPAPPELYALDGDRCWSLQYGTVLGGGGLYKLWNRLRD